MFLYKINVSIEYGYSHNLIYTLLGYDDYVAIWMLMRVGDQNESDSVIWVRTGNLKNINWVGPN